MTYGTWGSSISAVEAGPAAQEEGARQAQAGRVRAASDDGTEALVVVLLILVVLTLTVRRAWHARRMGYTHATWALEEHRLRLRTAWLLHALARR
jgi:hypothetical protein